MQRQRSQPEPSVPAVESGPGRGRIQSVDILRGLVMALMALDHTRGFFGEGSFNPRDVTEPALFLTRWITHLCAPTFVLLAGLSAYLYGRGKPLAELSRFLFIRGLWLILIEFTVVRLAWTFELGLLDGAFAGVIWVIGASMIVLAALVHLPRPALIAVALIMIAGHNLLDGVKAQELGAAGGLWHVLHQPGRVQLGASSVYVLYPLIPWIGVMAAGYALGPVMQLDAASAAAAFDWPWRRRSRSASSPCVPPISMAIRRHGRRRRRRWRRSSPSSIARNIRRRCSFS